MTTPPLDLPALRAKLRITKVTDNTTVLALLDRVEKAERACQTLGRVIDRQCDDALTATDSQDLLWGDDGDGDWGAIWERVLGLGEKAREATARAEAAERDLAAVTVSRDGWKTRAEAAEKKVAAGLALADTYDRHDGHRSVHRFNVAHSIRTALDNLTPETETTP